jgi:transposase
MWIQSQSLEATVQQRQQLAAWLRAGTTQQRVAFRCHIILSAIAGKSNSAIARELDTSRPTVILWRNRFRDAGPDALLRDLPRGQGIPPLSKRVVEKIIQKTLETKPKDATNWSTRTMAKECGISHSSVARVWDASNLKPHLVKTFKLSNDKHFVEKLKDVVGLYLNPPEHALVFSIDEKTQIQALDRTQLPLPLTKGHSQTVTHDYKRNGTTTLFAALNILKGEVIGECVKKHRHQEFIKFLQLIDQAVNQDLEVHCIVDNYSTHKHQKVKLWLEKHPRFHFHFIPTSSSWLNLVERWFGEITRKRIRRGTFHSVPELIQAIEDYIQINNQNPKPFIWTKTADEIIEKVNRCKGMMETLH